LTWYPSFGNL
jgi:hypothetical protein